MSRLFQQQQEVEKINWPLLPGIFKHFKLEAKLEMLRIRKYRAIMQTILIDEFRCLQISDDSETAQLSMSHLLTLVHLIHNDVEHVDIPYMREQEYLALNQFSFPKVYSLRYVLVGVDKVLQKHVSSLLQKFPNLERLWPSGQLNMDCMMRMPKLQHVSLFKSRNVKYDEFLELVATLKLKSLELDIFTGDDMYVDWQHFKLMEILLVNTHELKFLSRMGENLAKITKLRRLQITDGQDWYAIETFVRNLGRYKWQEAKGMELASIPEHTIKMLLLNSESVHAAFGGIKRLSICGVYNSFFNVHRSVVTKDLLHALRELHFSDINVRMFEHFYDLLNTKRLTLIDLDNCLFEFYPIELHIAEITKDRAGPLTVNFYQNYACNIRKPSGIENLTIKILDKESPMFKVTSQKCMRDISVAIQLTFTDNERELSQNLSKL